MKKIFEKPLKLAPFVLTVLLWRWIYYAPLWGWMNAGIIVGGVLLTIPLVWWARRELDQDPTVERVERITTALHYSLMILLGMAIARAAATHAGWPGPSLPVPEPVGRLLVIICGSFTLLTVLNLALRGLGAPFAVALSRRLASDWLYAWTRNPMVLGTLATLAALGLWFQSFLFVAWALLLVAPAWLYFVKAYEERELEVRFGQPYLDYKARTSVLFPCRPKK